MHKKPHDPFKSDKKVKVKHTTLSIRVPSDHIKLIKEIAVKCHKSPNAIICEILGWGIGKQEGK